MSPYRYLFPFEKVPYGASIVIYGAGVLGQEYLQQLQITQYCQVVAMIDRNAEKYQGAGIKVYAPCRLHELEFDYIVVALRGQVALNEVLRILHHEGVNDEHIVYVLERTVSDFSMFPVMQTGQEKSIDGLSYLRYGKSLSISMMLLGGLGDLIIQKKFVQAVIEKLPEVHIDLYCVNQKAFLTELYDDCQFVENIIEDLGYRYRQGKGNYYAGITVNGTSFLHVDYFDEKDISSEKYFLHDTIYKLQEYCRSEALGLTIPPIVSFLRSIKRGLNCYTCFSCGGLFNIKDKVVDVPLQSMYIERFRVLALRKYVTVNLSNGSCTDGSKIAKTWPQNYYERLLALLKEHYPGVNVVQLGDASARPLDNADLHILGQPLGLVEHILANAILHVDIEGGLVHLATQLGTKCAVLFGPTPMEYYGYEQNINISAGNCHGCYGCYVDVNRCARGLAEPECMLAITPELVMSEIAGYMSSLCD